MFNLTLMKQRVLDMIDSTNPYSQSDFEKEFSGNFNQELYDTANNKINVSFVNESNNQDPEYETTGASGFDFRAHLPNNDVILEVGKIKIIPTGLFFQLPDNFEIQVRPRSGLAAKYGITVLNSPGTIDADYRGESKIILINLGENDFTIKNGDRIAQGVIATTTSKNAINLKKMNELDNNTERGANGFGSTGIK